MSLASSISFNGKLPHRGVFPAVSSASRQQVRALRWSGDASASSHHRPAASLVDPAARAALVILGCTAARRALSKKQPGGWPKRCVATACFQPYNSAIGGRMRIADILNREDGGKGLLGEKVVVCGWVRTLRPQSERTFVKLNDGSTMPELQVVIEAGTPGLEQLTSQGTGASLRVEGVLVESPAKGQEVEVSCKDADHAVKVLGAVESSSYPLAKKRHSVEYMRTIAHLRPRANLFSAVTRVRNVLSYATHQFFQDRKFLYIHTPILTSSDCEGAGEMFRVSSTAEDSGEEGDFFGKPAFLTVSGQLNVESFACSMGDVYTFGPTFRAESSNTTRHLAEFWMIEPEMAFADLQDDMQCAEDYLKHCARAVLDKCGPDLEFFTERVDKDVVSRLKKLASPEPYARISYTEAVEKLEKVVKEGKKKFDYPPEWGCDLQTEHERWLAEELFEGPVIVYNYPKDIKSFYMRLNEDDRTVAAMDILAPGVGEIIGGSQREDRLENLDARMEELNLPKEEYWWYRELRMYGSVPHAGFGLGFERLVMLCTGVQNIRETIPFPRYKGHATF